jgi:sugar phosphate isomerase/epimerase
MTLTKYGIKITCHHEFWCGLRDEDAILKFYEWTDPRYVFFFLDTAQHVIAGVDPIKLYMKLHDRIGGFHLKDTHNIAGPEDYRTPPDSELMVANVPRWFYEVGTPEGLCDFPRLYQCMKEYAYKGWVSVEHDKAEIGGGNFSESTANAMWYIKNVLSEIYE